MVVDFSSLGAIGWVVAGVFALAFVAVTYMNVRARRLHGALGAFSCAVLIDGVWHGGVGQYGASSLLWYKLMSFSPSPVIAASRYAVELSSARPHGDDPQMVEVTVTAGEQSWDMAVDVLTYNGLVSWVESGAPHSTRF